MKPHNAVLLPGRWAHYLLQKCRRSHCFYIAGLQRDAARMYRTNIM